jgi:hypothetical protein
LDSAAISSASFLIIVWSILPLGVVITAEPNLITKTGFCIKKYLASAKVSFLSTLMRTDMIA